MSILVKIGPADHGRPMTIEEHQTGDYEAGYQYELIDGKLYVLPLPNAPQGVLEHWLQRKLQKYSDRHPEIINFVYNKARVFVHSRQDPTIPEPDLAAFRDFPLDLPFMEIHWEETSPLVVAEVLSAEDPNKDLVRNVTLYFEVQSIKEYWVLDGRADPDRPSMKVFRRHGKRWRIIDVPYGEIYTTRLLPGFELLVDPRKK